MDDRWKTSRAPADEVARLRGIFAGGVTAELVRRACGPLGHFLGWQPVAGWERLEGDRFSGAVSHLAVVGTVPFELPGVVGAYLFAGVGPEPSAWGAASTPSQTAEVWLRCTDADVSGLNQVLWTEDIVRRPQRPEVRLPHNMPAWLTAQADQLTAHQRQHFAETLYRAREAIAGHKPREEDDFWSLPGA